MSQAKNQINNGEIELKLLIPAALAVLLAGCAPTMLEKGLRDLRDSKMSEVAVFASQIGGYLSTGHSEEEAITQSKQLILDRLHDADSAQFKGIKLKPYLRGFIVCGEVDAQNSYGEYVGFSRFAAGVTGIVVEDLSSPNEAVNAARNSGLNRACPQ